jgi:hypothetical protein
MVYVLQNVKTKKYLKHNGNYDPEAYPYIDVDKIEDAEHYPSFPHADHVRMWNVDYTEKFEIVTYEPQN